MSLLVSILVLSISISIVINISAILKLLLLVITIAICWRNFSIANAVNPIITAATSYSNQSHKAEEHQSKILRKTRNRQEDPEFLIRGMHSVIAPWQRHINDMTIIKNPINVPQLRKPPNKRRKFYFFLLQDDI